MITGTSTIIPGQYFYTALSQKKHLVGNSTPGEGKRDKKKTMAITLSQRQHRLVGGEGREGEGRDGGRGGRRRHGGTGARMLGTGAGERVLGNGAHGAGGKGGTGVRGGGEERGGCGCGCGCGYG